MLTIDPFPYQDYAIDLGLKRGNLLIAYGMGLGKTVVQLAICEELLGSDEVTLNALVVPAGLKWQWAQALAWATDVESRELKMKDQRITVPTEDYCVVINGTPKHRAALYKKIRKERPDYVILGYENVINDWRDVRSMNPDLIALDEATAIASFSSIRSQTLKLWDAPFRYALTGTPINNKADELFSIMEWVDPEELGRADLFDKAYVRRDGYGRVQSYKNLHILHEKIGRFVARKIRFDPDVAPYLPKDFHKEIFVGLAPQTKRLYKHIAAELMEDLEEMVGDASFSVEAYYSGAKSSGSMQQGAAMGKIMALNMLCDHPALLQKSADDYNEWFTSAASAALDEKETGLPVGSSYAASLADEGLLDIPMMSPKFDQVVDDVKDLLLEDKRNKVIVFSFYKHMATLLKEDLGDTAVIYNGDMSIPEKEAAKMRFKRDADTRVFLSSDAGGMGVDLPEANYLINYDLPASAGKSDQRDNRHVRAGSDWSEVFVLNYLVEDSLEHLVNFERLKFKRAIGSAILDGKIGEDGVLTNEVLAVKTALSTGI